MNQKIIKLISIIFLTSALSCTRTASQLDAASSVEASSPQQPPVISGKIYSVGTGSGNLVIDGNDFRPNGTLVTLQNGDGIKILGGSYDSIMISNISVSSSTAPVVITNDGQITFDGNYKVMQLRNLKNVAVTGTGTQGIASGFEFKNNVYRSITLNQPINNFTLRNLKFSNIGDYVISYSDQQNIAYVPGDASTYSQNLRFLNILADNTSSVIAIGGGMENNKFEGFIKNIEIAGLQITNSATISTAVHVGCPENYDVHNNYVDNINTGVDNHNGIFFLKGSGKFYNNLVQNHQGNVLRAWPFSITKPGTVEIYNNIAYNSRRYSGFEVQVINSMHLSTVFSPVNVKVYSNTVGKMNVQLYSYAGRLFDVYEIYGPIEVYDNLVFDDNDSDITNNVTTTPTRMSNNIYKATSSLAVVDLINYASIVPGVGAVKQSFVVP